MDKNRLYRCLTIINIAICAFLTSLCVVDYFPSGGHLPRFVHMAWGMAIGINMVILRIGSRLQGNCVVRVWQGPRLLGEEFIEPGIKEVDILVNDIDIPAAYMQQSGYLN